MTGMRILLVTGLVAGGVGRHVEMLSRGLTAAGCQVVVACPPEVAERFDLAGTVVDLPVGASPRPGRDVRAIRSLRAIMRGADVVHAHGLRAGALAVLAHPTHRSFRLDRAPGEERDVAPRLVVTTHNAAPEGRAAGAVYDVMERIVARGTDLVLGVSPDLVDRAERAGAGGRVGLAVVPATRTAQVDRGAAREALLAELALPSSARLVLVVGRLAPQKDLGLALAAHAQLVGDVGLVGRRSEPSGGGLEPPRPVGLYLLIAGDGPQRPELEALAAGSGGSVRLLGHRDDVPSLLAAADVVLSTARWEGQPVWLQEALQQGCAIVATDVGGTAQVVGSAALLVGGTGRQDAARQASVQEVAQAVARVLDDPVLQQDLRARALARAAELPTEADAIEAALAVYEPAAR